MNTLPYHVQTEVPRRGTALRRVVVITFRTLEPFANDRYRVRGIQHKVETVIFWLFSHSSLPAESPQKLSTICSIPCGTSVS